MKKGMLKFLRVFPILLFLYGMGTGIVIKRFANIYPVVQQEIAQRTFDVNKLEQSLKDNFMLRIPLIEVSGFWHKATGRRLSDDGNFYLDGDGFMHNRYKVYENFKYDGLIASTGRLAEYLERQGIPFLVCQTAERANYGDMFSWMVDGELSKYIVPLRDSLPKRVAYLNYDDEYSRGGVEKSRIFFKTDTHYCTEAEYYILNKIVERLERDCGLTFGNKSEALNLENYQIEEYSFLGNFAASAGKLYAGEDCFQYYLPMFPTSMELHNPSASIVKEGDFEAVVLNGYRASHNSSNRVYRITDYMQYPSPCYTITNRLVKENRVLVIGCSMSMRTNAYLTLLCHEVTVLDPRSFGEVDYLKQALERQQYDAVILYPSVHLKNGIGRVS